jgi:hypothetical protein
VSRIAGFMSPGALNYDAFLTIKSMITPKNGCSRWSILKTEQSTKVTRNNSVFVFTGRILDV